MRTRPVIVVSVVVLAAVALVWYVALAPSRASFVEPGPSELAVTATQNGNGSWVRYLVNVKNLGDVGYDGDVVLVNRIQGSAAPGTSPAVMPYTHAVPPAAMSIGTAAVPAVAPDSAYEAHVTVPSRQEVTVSFFAPPGYAQAEALDNSGQPLGGTSVERNDTIPIAVISDSATAADQLAALSIADVPLTVFDFRRGRGFPADASLLAGYVTVVLDQFNTSSLSQRQLAALRDFVGLGGNLIVAAGSSWRQTVLPLPSELTPVRPVATAPAPMAPVEELAGRQLGLVAPVATGTAATSARAVLTENGTVLIGEASYGAGLVVQLAYDPAAAPIAGTKLAADAWSQAIGRGLVMQPGSSPMTHSVPGPESLQLDLFPPAADQHLPSPWLVGPLLLAYLLVVGPVNYLVLRQRLHRPALVWVSTPLISILFASSFYGIGSRLQGSLRDDEIQLLKVAPQGAVSSFEYNQVLFASRGDHQLGLSGGSLVAPMTLSTYQDFAATCTRCLVQLAGVQVGEEHVTGGSQPAVSERGVAYGSVRVVGTAAVAHAKFGVVPHLVISGGHLKGSLTNEGASALYNLALFASDGTNYQRIGLPDLPPHATVQVDSAPESVGTTTLAPGMRTSQAARLDVIENAIAMAALAQSPQPVLVGFSDLQPGRLLVDGADPPRIGIAAFEQPLGLDGADATLAEWSRIRLAAIAGTSPNFEDVYDIELPPAVSSFDLVYDSRLYPSLELYDWAAGAWRQVPGSGSRDQTVKVGGAMIADGVVRVRVKESQITWGTALGFQG